MLLVYHRALLELEAAAVTSLRTPVARRISDQDSETGF